MGRYQHLRARRPAVTEPAPDPSATEYQAPTVGLEDQVFTIGSTKDAANFELLKWSDGADSAMAFETLTEPMHDEPAKPVMPERFYNYKDKSVEDPE